MRFAAPLVLLALSAPVQAQEALPYFADNAVLSSKSPWTSAEENPHPWDGLTMGTEVFAGAARWREIAALYDAGNTVDGWFLEKLTWSREAFEDPDERTGIAVFIKIAPDVY